MLDGVFQATLQGRPDDPAGVTLDWGSMLAIMGAPPGGRPGAPRRGPARADARPRQPDLGHRLHRARARGRAHRARRHLGRDVGGGQHDQPHARLRRDLADRLRAGPYRRLLLRQGALRALLGPDLAHDAARRGLAPSCGRRAHRVGRHGPAHAARRAAARRLGAVEHVGDRPGAGPAAGRRRLPGLPPRGARRRPTRSPVARFLLFERTYPDSVAASVDAVHNALYRADGNPRNSEPVLRLQRLSADLEFRGRAAGRRRRPARHAARRSRRSWSASTATSRTATSPVPRRHHGRRMNFAIRYLTEYRYEGQVTDNLNALRVRPATTSTQRVRRLPRPRRPRGAPAAPPRLLRHRGHRVRRRPAPRPPVDRRARARGHRRAGRPAGRGLGGARSRLLRGRGRRVPALRRRRARERRRSTSSSRPRAPRARWRRCGCCASSCPIASSTAGAPPTSAPRSRTCSTPARASARTSSTSGSCSCAATGSPRATSRATCGPRPSDGGSDSVEVDTHAWLEALLPGGGQRGEPVWVGADPTNRRMAGETHVKIGHGRAYHDVPPIKGVYRGPGSAALDAAVTMTRLDPQASARA